MEKKDSNIPKLIEELSASPHKAPHEFEKFLRGKGQKLDRSPGDSGSDGTDQQKKHK